MYKWIGGGLIFVSCAMFGFSISLSHKREEMCFRQLIALLDYMECELQYRLTPLPDLCRQASRQVGGCVGQVFDRLAEELESQISPDVYSCMCAALGNCDELPQRVNDTLLQLGRSFGRFDLQGQVNGLDAARGDCRRILSELAQNRDNRLRSYQTLGLCAGAALVILFV